VGSPVAASATPNTGGGGGGAGAGTDAGGNGGSGIVIVRVALNKSPTANAGPDQTVQPSQPVTLNGTSSSDPDLGNTLTYSWVQTGGTSVTLSSATASQPTFTAPVLPSGTPSATLTFSLTVTDQIGLVSTADTVNVTVDPRPTVALSGHPFAVNPTVVSSYTVTATFSEVVTGFDASDVVVTNGTASSVSGSGTTYTITITPGASGDIGVSVPENRALDSVNNGNTASNSVTTLRDTTVPTVTLSGQPGFVNSLAAYAVTATFSEAVTGFVAGDVTVTNGTVTGISGSGTTYTLTITPNGAGDIGVLVPANAALDVANNGNTASTTVSTVFDNTPPTPVLSTTVPWITSSAQISVTVNFGEPVTGFAAGDVSITGGTVSSVSGSGSTYTLIITPTGGSSAGGTNVVLSIPAGGATDSANNNNLVSNTLTIPFRADILSASTVTVNPDAIQVVPGVEATITVTLSGTGAGPYTGQTVALSLNNSFGTIIGPVVDAGGGVYTVKVRGTAVGNSVIRATVNGGQITATANIQFLPPDTVPPTVTLSASSLVLTTNSPFNITATFDEAVTGFDTPATDLVVTGGAATAITGGPAVYTVTIQPSGTSNAVSIQVPADAARDLGPNASNGTNPNIASQPLTLRYGPSLANSTISASPTSIVANGTTTSTITVQLRDLNNNPLTMSGGTVALSTTHGTLGAVTDHTNGSYSATLTSVTTAGTATISGTLAGSAITDTATVEMTPGPVSLATSTIESQFSSLVANGTTTSTITVQLKDANGNNLTASAGAVALSTTRGTLGPVTDNTNGSYTATLTSSTTAGEATITGTLALSTITDTATVTMTPGPASAAQSTLTASHSPIKLNGGTSTITVTVKDAQGNPRLTGGDTVTLATNLGSLSVVTDVGDGTYTAILTSGATDGSARVTATINTTQGQFVDVIFDPRPSVSLTAPSSVSTGAAFSVTATFSEDVTGFALGDITVTNGTASALAGGPAIYTFDVTPTGPGAVDISIAADVAEDADMPGNLNTAATPVSVTFDPLPTVQILDVPVPHLSATAPFQIKIQFSEAVTGFDLTDIPVTEGSASGLTGSGATYFVTITPNGSGNDITLNVPQGAAQDASNQPSAAASQVVVDVNAPPPEDPTVVLSAAVTVISSLDPFDVTAEFSEPVTGFVLADITVTGGTAVGLVDVDGNANIYRITIQPNGTGDISILVAEGKAESSSSGRPNEESNPLVISFSATEQTQAAISDYMLQRAGHLIANQPGLLRLLSGKCGGFEGQASLGAGALAGCRQAGNTWAALSRSWSQDESYSLGAFGLHHKFNDDLIIGVLAEIDHFDDKANDASGTGWLLGPYVVAKHPSSPLYFEGRLLYGQSANNVSPFGTYVDAFDTDRLLAQARVTGQLLRPRMIWMPFLDLSFVRDSQRSYKNALGDVVPELTVNLTQLSGGLDFQRPITLARGGDLTLAGGVAVAYARAHAGDIGGGSSGTAQDRNTLGSAFHLGLDYQRDNLTFNLRSALNGIGTNQITKSIALAAEWRF
jgi:hypothetical protein